MIAVVNLAIEARDKKGNKTFGPTQLETMFSSLSGTYLTDPKILFNVHQERFVVVLVANTASADCSIWIATSNTSNPTDSTTNHGNIWSINAYANGFVNDACADYRGIAVHEEAP